MGDKMTRTSFFLSESVLKKVKKLAHSRHEPMAASMRYLIEKGLDESCLEEMIEHTKSEDKLTKFRLFKLMIRIESIAKKLMDKSAHDMDIKEYSSFVEMHEKGFCEEFEMKQ